MFLIYLKISDTVKCPVTQKSTEVKALNFKKPFKKKLWQKC